MQQTQVTAKDLENSYDFDFRPRAYFGEPAACFANIMGDERRKRIKAEMEAGRGSEIPEALFASELRGPLRLMLGGIHPQMMGGEYLPDLLENELEIARVRLASTTGDVMSLRARPDGSEILYRIVDEYAGDGYWTYDKARKRSTDPLSFGELVQWIDHYGKDDCDYGHDCGAKGLVMPFFYQQWECGDDLDQTLEFVTVSSEFYPELGVYYQERGAIWFAENSEPEDEDDDEE